MGKALKTAGMIIGAAALIATGVGALAMPGLAGATTLFGVSTGTLNTISAGLAAVGGMLDKPKSQGSGAPDEWTSNPDQPIPFLFGRMGIAGKIVQRDEFGPDNMYQGIVGVLSGAGPIKGVESFRADDQAVTFGVNGKAITSQWVDEMWMVRRSGAQPDTALTVPAGLKAGGAPFEWSSSAKLSGKACYLQILGENSKGSAYSGGIPDPGHVAEGVYGYDPRYDSTYPGGDGPCRLGVRSTYRYITDPIIGGLNWSLGMVENGQVVGGIGATTDGIDMPAFVEAANISEANGWKLAAWPDTSEDVSAVLDQFLQAGGAVRARHAGKISCVSRGAPRASVATITAKDMAGTIEMNTAPSLFDQLNTITPRFMSEAGGWKLTPANPVSFPAYVTSDGGKHSDQIDYRFCPLLKQAAELAAYDILDAREPFSGSVTLKAHMRLLKRGDCFVVNEPGVLLDGVKCIVLSRSYDPKTAQVRIGFRSETDSKHALALGKTTTLPAFPSLTPVDAREVSPPEAGDWTIAPREPTDDGVQLPIWDLVGSVTNATATAVIVEWGEDPGEGEPLDGIAWNEAYFGSPTATRIPIQGMQPGGTYYVAVRNRRDSNFSLRTLYGPEVVPALVALTSEDAEALDRLDRIDSDGWLTKGEKPAVLAQYQTVVGEYAGVAARLTAAGLSSELSAYSGAKTTLDAYIDALSPDLDDFDEDTAIVGEDLRYAFEMYFYARQTAINALLADARTRADAAAASADAALDDLDVIVSDSWLSRNEKPRLIEQFAVIQNETTALRDQAEAFGALTQRTAYIAAYDALAAYLASLSPAWDSLSVDTPVVGVDLRYAFEIYYLRRQEMLTAQMGITDADAAEALSRLAIIDADGWLSRGEKPQVVREYEAIIAEFGPLRDQAAAVGATTERTALIAAVDALNAYLAGLSPVWSDTATDTAIVSATFRARFTAYYEAAQITQSAIASAVGEDGAEAVARLAVIDSDNWLSRGEKSDVIRVWQALDGEFASLNAQAVALGITDPLYAYFEALTDLGVYLDSLSPDWDNTAVDTPIVGPTFRANFNAVYLARTALQNAMIDTLDDAVEIVIGRLDDIASDNILSRNEKPEIIRQYSTIAAEKPGIVTRLTAAGVSSTAYVAAFDALTSYLGGLTPAWNDLAQNTPITGTTFRQKFVDYYVARAAADDASISALGADAAEALAALTIIASDNWLSTGEKATLIREVANLNADVTSLTIRAAALGITTELTTFSTKVAALNSYLSSLSPTWDNVSVDTAIDGPTLRFVLYEAYETKQALLNAFDAAIDANADAAHADLAIIYSDNWLSRTEKPTVIREHATLNGDYSGLAARATNLGVTTELTAHADAINALNSYLGGLSPAWNSLTVDTPMTGATLRSRFETAYATKQTLLNAFTAVLDANADAALSDLAIIASDNWLSRSEKPEVKRQYDTLNAEFSGLNAQAVDLGITDPLYAYYDALTALGAYLSGLSPTWDNFAVDTPMTGSTLRSRIQTVYNTKTALQTAMLAASGGAPLTVSSTARGIARNVSSPGTYTTTDSITLTISGGSGSYAWEWVLMSSNSNGGNALTASISGSTGTGSTTGTTFTATVAGGETVFGGMVCVIRDTVTGATISSFHTGRIVNTA